LRGRDPKGDPWDNSCAESCISTIKNELVKRRSFVTRDPARLPLFRYIESFHNPPRRHSSLAMLRRRPQTCLVDEQSADSLSGMIWVNADLFDVGGLLNDIEQQVPGWPIVAVDRHERPTVLGVLRQLVDGAAATASRTQFFQEFREGGSAARSCPVSAREVRIPPDDDDGRLISRRSRSGLCRGCGSAHLRRWRSEK